MRTVLINNLVMESLATASCSESLESVVESRSDPIRLSALHAGTTGQVVSVGTSGREVSSTERRLLELGFVSGERIEVIAEARPGRDPFVVRIGATTLALRRRDVESVWVSVLAPERA
jgi:ferrous iron transport protein A